MIGFAPILFPENIEKRGEGREARKKREESRRLKKTKQERVLDHTKGGSVKRRKGKNQRRADTPI